MGGSPSFWTSRLKTWERYSGCYGRPSCPGEDATGVDVRPVLLRLLVVLLLPLCAFGLLTSPPELQELVGLAAEPDGAGPAVALRGVLSDVVGDSDELLTDVYGAGGHVGLTPGQAAGLTAPGAPEDHEVEHRVEPVLGDAVEEGAGLLGCLAPARDALVGPHERLGRGVLRQDEVLGPVLAYELLGVLGVVERGAELVLS